MLGLDAAGKTTILYQLKLGEVVASVPTIGFNFESVQYKNVQFNVFDIGGQSRLRLLWRHYYVNTQALIYVLDSSDIERFEDARETLQGLLGEEELRGVPVLVLANKADVSTVKTVEIAKSLGMEGVRDRDWFIQSCCGLTREGVYEGMDWLAKKVQNIK